MSGQILGLLTAEKFAAESDLFFSHRRKILHSYPNGSAPLTGILSMVKEEETSSHEFYWYEKRYRTPRTATRGTNPLTSDAPSTGDADDGTNLAIGAKTTANVVFLKLDTVKDLRPGYIIEISGSKNIQLQVIAVTNGVTVASEKGYVQANVLRGFTHAAGDDITGTVVRILGTAYGEGATGRGIKPLGFKRPYNIMNQTQIFRTPMKFSGTVLQEGLKYDDTGPYKEKARDTVIEHMTSIERQLLFGQRSTTLRSSLDTTADEDEPIRTFSGILEFLRLWDAGSTGIDIDGSNYAPYAFKDADTSDSDDTKRIIENTDAIFTVDDFHSWAERVGRYSTNKSSEKLVLCGSGAVLSLAKMFRLNSDFNTTVGNAAYGLKFTTWHTPFGDFHFMTHPQFNEDPEWRYNAMILDVHSIKYRYLTGRDTKLLKNRQENDADHRKDEYLTECSIELHHPENNMLIKNLRNYQDS